MDFGQPNVEIGQKMADSQLLFLGLHIRTRPLSDKKTIHTMLYRILEVFLSKCFAMLCTTLTL